MWPGRPLPLNTREGSEQAPLEPAWLPTGPVPWVALRLRVAVTFNCAGVTFTLSWCRIRQLCRRAAKTSALMRSPTFSAAQSSSLNSLSTFFIATSALCEVALKGFVYVFACDLAKTDLHGFVTVVFDCLFLNDDARTSFNYCYGNEFAILVKKLCHTQLSCLRCIFAWYIPPVGYWLAAYAVNITFADKHLFSSKSAGGPGFSVLLNFSGKLLIKVLLRFLRLQGAQDL